MISRSFNPASRTALVIDENQHLARITKDFLAQAGLRSVVHTTSPDEALTYLSHMTVDVLFIDLHVKSGGGIELVKTLRLAIDSPCPAIPIVMMASSASAQDVCAARDAGATEFLARPISLTAMERVLKVVFEKSRPFVEAGGYKGPDRRRKRVAVPRDRRMPRRTPPKV